MEDEDELFDWAADTYQSDNLPLQGNQIDLTRYEVSLGPIYKEPDGSEYLESIEVKKKS